MLIKLTANKAVAIRINSIKAIGKLKIDKGSKQLFTLLKSDPQAEVRKASLQALAQLNDTQIGSAIAQALADKEKSVRVVGLDLLGKTELSKDLMIKLLNEVIENRTIEEKQAAITTLGRLPLENSNASLEKLLVTMESGKLPKETYLELAEAIDSTRSAPLITRYKQISKKLSLDSLQAAYEGSLLGGDADRGAGIFYGSQKAQCVRCHALGDYGGNAGPQLNGVASRLTREQILQSLIDPSARIAPGFGTVALEIKGGKKINGILQQEKPSGLLLKIADKPDTLILSEDIVSRTNGASSMPPMRFLLTKKEIRDVVSFLSSLKEKD